MQHTTLTQQPNQGQKTHYPIGLSANQGVNKTPKFLILSAVSIAVHVPDFISQFWLTRYATNTQRSHIALLHQRSMAFYEITRRHLV